MESVDRLLAIDDNELGDFSVTLMDYSDELGELFTSLDSKMNELALYFGGTAANDLFAQFRTFKNNFPIVRNNIISYSDDLITLITKVHEGDNFVANQVDNATEDVERQSQMIEQL